MKEETKTRRGGRREGAGRKKTTAKRIGFCAPDDIKEILDKQENMSNFICDAIRTYYEACKIMDE